MAMKSNESRNENGVKRYRESCESASESENGVAKWRNGINVMAYQY
jgi:hypothetical protein